MSIGKSMQVSSKSLTELLYDIAASYMVSVESRGDLDRRGNDSEDFIEVPVWGLLMAMEKAYELGKTQK